MKKFIAISLILTSGLVFGSCDNNENTTNKEKELLEKEVELLKKENELLQKTESYSSDKKEEVKIEKSIIENDEIQPNKTGGAQQETDDNYLIGNKKVGKFQIGQKAPSSPPNNFNVRKETRMVEGEGDMYEESYFVVSENGLDLLTYNIGYNYETKSENVITEIKIISEKLKTIKNIGIGSTIEDFESIYPDFEIWYTYISEIYVIETKSIKAQFILCVEDFIGDTNASGDMIILNKTDFKANSKIKEIRII